MKYRGVGVIRWMAEDGKPGKDGVNYVFMGAFDFNTTYSKTPLGIPYVEMEGNPDPNKHFTYFALDVDVSTQGRIPNTNNPEWRIIESDELRVMQNALIKRLKADLITAANIEALNIVTSNLEVTDGAKIGGFYVDGDKLVSAKSGKRIEIDPINKGIVFKDKNNKEVARLATYTNNWTELRFVSYHTNGKPAKILNLSNVVGLTVQEMDYDGITPTGKSVRYGAGGEIINGNLTNMSDAQANNYASGTFYRTGRIVKVVP